MAAQGIRERTTLRRTGFLVAALLVLVVAAFLSLAVGSRHMSLGTVWSALLHGGDSPDAVVVRSMRVPRTVVGIAVGAALGLAGTGAAVGVVTAIAVFGVGSLTGYVWFGLAGALLTGVAVYAVASRGRGGATPVKLALAGQALAASLGAVVTGILTTDQRTLDEYRFWLAGSLSGRTADVAWQVLPFLAVGATLVVAVARGLDALALGDDVAAGL
ncbi:MAG: iron chelate uptake ABC transporter family permease subunit, partial [Streptomycetaceae bacterium]|nr:iron chelate uptake ABC transporter family permease subunit [Streptomycetaceae bacterium]